jgi:hypothetical protein
VSSTSSHTSIFQKKRKRKTKNCILLVSIWTDLNENLASYKEKNQEILFLREKETGKARNEAETRTGSGRKLMEL